MSELITRILPKLTLLWFWLVHGASFKVLGRSASMLRPFRVDGAAGIELGPGTVVQRGGWLYCQGIEGLDASLKIGAGCAFGYNNHIASVRSVKIGDHVLTANNVYISDNLHGYEDVTRPIMHQPVRFKKAVIIGDGCWIGENACIIGATIGRNSIIGANAVVTRDIPDFSVAVGIPAEVIRQFDHLLQQWVDVGQAE